MDVRPDQRGVVSGMLSLSRNLGLITGASVMGALFAFTSATSDITTARPEAVAGGMRITFAAAALLIVGAIAIAVLGRFLSRRPADGLLRGGSVPIAGALGFVDSTSDR